MPSISFTSICPQLFKLLNHQSKVNNSKMEFKFTLITAAILMGTVAADSAGYVLPSTGSASTTQFYLGPELSSGTACGVDALPNGQSTSGKQGGGPGYLYVCSPARSSSWYKLLLTWNRQQSTNWPSVPIHPSLGRVDLVEHVVSATGLPQSLPRESHWVLTPWSSRLLMSVLRRSLSVVANTATSALHLRSVSSLSSSRTKCSDAGEGQRHGPTLAFRHCCWCYEYCSV